MLPTPPGSRAALVAAGATAAMVLALAQPASAAVKDSRRCRSAIGTLATQVVRAGFQAATACHHEKNAVCTPAVSGGSDREDCNVAGNETFDRDRKYAGKKTRANQILEGGESPKCRLGDPVLANYPPSGDVTDSIFPDIDEDVTGSSAVVQGQADLECSKAKSRCLDVIGRERSKIVHEIVADAARCQRKIDKSATTFGEVDPSCLANPADEAAPKAARNIAAACTSKGLGGSDVGSCDPLPACVVDAATQTGLSLARAIYYGGQVCGNGDVEGTEQCDDGNTLSGDGCDADCQTEGDTCDGAYAGAGAADGIRRVVVSIDTPEPLGGVEIGIDYPQFQAGIPGLGNSSIVNSRFTALQPAGLAGMSDSGTDAKVVMVDLTDGLDSGDLFQIDFDNCVDLEQHVCNRNQNVIGCCSGGLTPSCSSNPPSCGTQPSLDPPVIGMCSNPGGCPGDNACVSQAGIMSCSVSNPSDLDGQPVAGVTCSVAITELP
jgi:cysteine-rich repeat protein